VEVGREDIFKPTIANECLHEIINYKFATSKHLSRVQCSHITTFINTPKLLLKGKHKIRLITS